jgi:hypothetical protein
MAAAARLRQLLASPHLRCKNRSYCGRSVSGSGRRETLDLLSHKSKPVREASAATLAKFGDSRLDKTKLLLAARKTDTRLAAVAWLQAIGAKKAAKALKARLDEEEDDNIRDAILLALEKLEGNALETHPDEGHKRINRSQLQNLRK